MVLGLFWGVGWACAALSQNNDHVLARAYWQDTSAQATFDNARMQTYLPYQGILNQGYSQSVHWVRLTLAPSHEPLGLRITPAWLDTITLFDPVSATPPVTRGDRHSADQNALAGMGHSFALPANTETREIWLRLQSTSSHFMNVEAMAISLVPAAASKQIAWATFYTAVQMLILITLFAIWWLQRDMVLSAFLFRHLVYTYYGMAYLGLPTLILSDWLPPTFFDLAFSISTIAVVSAGVFFDVILLSFYRPHKKLLMLIKTIGMFSLFLLALLLAGHVQLSLQLNALVLIFGTVVIALAAISSQPDPLTQPIIPKKFMVAYYLLVLSSLLVGLLNVLGWVPVLPLTLHALILHGLLSGLLMASILLVRAQGMRNRNREVTWQLQKAQQDIVAEQRQRQEQSQFLHMLMHELKTPLSVVALAIGTKTKHEENLGHAGRAIKDMKAILDRCVQADQLSQLTRPQNLCSIDASSLIRQHALCTPALHQRLQIQCAEPLPFLQSDPQLVQIILSNLLDNAHAYSDPATPVTVDIQPEQRLKQGGLSVCLRNKPGIAGWPEANRVFDKYYRAVGAQRGSGSGLGLFLSRQLAQSLGGTLNYARRAQLVEFTLWLPLSHN